MALGLHIVLMLYMLHSRTVVMLIPGSTYTSVLLSKHNPGTEYVMRIKLLTRWQGISVRILVTPKPVAEGLRFGKPRHLVVAVRNRFDL